MFFSTRQTSPLEVGEPPRALVTAGLGQFLAHMTDVGDVLDVGYLHAAVNQRTADPIGHKVGP